MNFIQFYILVSVFILLMIVLVLHKKLSQELTNYIKKISINKPEWLKDIYPKKIEFNIDIVSFIVKGIFVILPLIVGGVVVYQVYKGLLEGLTQSVNTTGVIPSETVEGLFPGSFILILMIAAVMGVIMVHLNSLFRD